MRARSHFAFAFAGACAVTPAMIVALAALASCSDGRPPVLNNPNPTSTSTTTLDAAPPVDAPFDGPPLTTVASLQNATDLEVGGGFLWIAAPNTGGTSGAIVRVPLSGGAPENVVTSLAEPARVTYTSTSVLYTTSRASDGLGALGLFALADAGVTSLAPTTYSLGLTTDVQFVYASDSTTTLHVLRRAIAGGAGAVDFASTISTAHASAIVVTATNAFVAATDGIVYSVDIGGGALGVLEGPLDGPCGDMAKVGTDLIVAVDAAAPKGEILRFPQAGGAPTVLATGLDHPNRLVADTNRVYWSSATSGAVSYTDLAKIQAHDLAVGLDAPGALALDTQYVYVATKGQVARVTKP